MKRIPICSLFILSLFARPSSARAGTRDVPQANPGRPTVSTPATLNPVGYVRVENGAIFAEHATEFSKRTEDTLLTKLSVLPRLELFLQSELPVSHDFSAQARGPWPQAR